LPTHPTNAAGGKRTDTAEWILDVAERLVQLRGYNAFSYADVARELGITKASLHYHFASKAELGQALVSRYERRFCAALAEIDDEPVAARVKLIHYTDLYASALRGERMCLCGMLAAEYQTLPATIREAVVGFFDENERWLSRVLEQGRAEHTLRFEGPARDTAQTIISGLEGAMLVARPYGDLARFKTTAATLLGGLVTPEAR
jgi:TetR/AcrR family transcriptional regulator, transcriptional repressor for nem operon